MKHILYFSRDYHHVLHSSDKQLNSIVDIIISTLEFTNIKYMNISQMNIDTLVNKNKILKEISSNQQYIKDQLNTVLEKLHAL